MKDSANSLPPEFASHRVLPSLVNALEFGGAPASQIIPLVLQLGVHASDEDQQTVVIAPILKLYSSQDRGTRMALLEHLNEYSDKLDKSTVADKVWPHLVCYEFAFKDVAVLMSRFSKRALQIQSLSFARRP